MVLDEHLMPIPSWTGQHCHHITMEIPKVPLEKPIQVLQIITAPIGKESWRDDTICSGLMSGMARGQADRSPLILVEELMGKAPIFCGTREWEHLIPTRVSPGGTGGDTTQHLGTFVAVTSLMAPKSAHLLCIPNTQGTICSVQSAVRVGGRGLFCSFYELIYDLFTCMSHPHC